MGSASGSVVGVAAVAAVVVAGRAGAADELFSCVTFSDTRAVFGAPPGSIMLGQVLKCPLLADGAIGSVRGLRRPTSNNHRYIVGCRFVGSDVLATQSRADFSESRVTFASHRRRRKPTIGNSGVNPPPGEGDGPGGYSLDLR
ncbi:hypothetical protein THAOC_01285 [Thalassiosira oceanica]|uniref:Uncharacterized protein n=1 Tax=Thalassiosira oceanica TaxID=159749 RepID=K0THJ2_THAOC|nr:hypothetical protein THAOC_01285 [Thalassiosira oceanica]|eukprot:EJK76925.1 hypothetical protein THAOC_01285 [Thalassiosira oceanica]